MREVTDLEAERLASAFRPNRKPLIIAIIANGALALLLLGIPYLRGRTIAADARRNFADLSRCLMGGEIAKDPGLSLPQGDREQFATKVMRAGPGWPLSCRPQLRKLAPESAIFLWPSVKQASADLRAAVELTERELETLAQRRKAGLRSVPERPLQALRRAQAAAVLLARAGGAESGLDNDALVFKGSLPLADPARLPLMASSEATLDLYSDGTALEALALDGRGVSYLRVADGKVDRERVRRTSFVRGAVRSGEEAYLVWAMPDAKCAEREDHCAGRPTGLAPYDKGAAALRDPVWKLDGHPAGRLDRALRIGESGRALMVARAAADGGTALLRFQLEMPPVNLGAEAGGPAVLEATDRFEVTPVAAAQAVTFVNGAEPAAVLAAHTDPAVPDALAVRLVWADAARAAVALPPVSGEYPWTLGCSTAGSQLLAYGTSTALRVVRLENDVPAELLTRNVTLPGALHSEDRALDRVRLVCSDARAQLFWIDATRNLWTTLCAADGCSEPRTIATRASSFAVLPRPDGAVIALGSLAEEIRVLRLDEKANQRAAAVAPSACFEPTSGLCGTPALVADAQRIVLTARDRSDLLALESTDGGATFNTLSGLAGMNSFDRSKTAPLEQHRVRKGIDQPR
jgi:hypothetical protein